MVLRQLLSGWLIAMAALARSVALALERASEDRSAPAPDPVMDALAERYPGAPAHWLAHVAERTAQLAEAGHAPLSLNSDPSAWPPMGVDGRLSRPLGLEAASLADRQRDPPRRGRQPPQRQEADVPTLAALRDRPSEVWRRSDQERPRRPRPVFAPVPDSAPPAERPGRATFAPEVVRRPRSPLSFAPLPSPSATADIASNPAVPMSEARASTAPASETAWSEPPAPPAGRLELANGPLEVRKPRANPPTDGFSAMPPRSNDVQEMPSEPHFDRAATTPARRQRAWFFAKLAAPRHESHLDLSPPRGHRASRQPAAAPGEVGFETPPASREAFRYSATPQRAVAPEPILRALTPLILRRPIFQAVAALRPRRRSRGRFQASVGAETRAAPVVHSPPPEPGLNPRGPPATRHRAARPDHVAPTFAPVEPNATPISAEDNKRHPAGVTADRRPASGPAPTHDLRLRDERSTFAGPHVPRSRARSAHFAESAWDDRWPGLPPPNVTSPPGVGVAPPRWEQLAHEQEEGRWSV